VKKDRSVSVQNLTKQVMLLVEHKKYEAIAPLLIKNFLKHPLVTIRATTHLARIASDYTYNKMR
jgi:hypothetical protein